MWNILGRKLDTRQFQPFIPCEVLYDFDGPRIFTIKDIEGELNLAYWSDEDEKDRFYRYVVVPTTSRIIDALKYGSISVFEALNQPRCWLCDISYQGELNQCQAVDFDLVPRDALPNTGTMLLPTLEPLLSQPIDLEGRIRELDKDRLSFELREISGPTQNQRFVFDQELLDDVFQAFQDNVRVKIAGKTYPVKNLSFALALSRTEKN